MSESREVRGDPPAEASGALLFPDPQPALTHLSVTLLREVVAGGLRFALYQLGFEPPEKPPIRIRELRLGLDGEALGRALDGTPGGAEVARALVDPGGAGRLPRGAGRLRGAAAFHRARLRLGLARRLPSVRSPVPDLPPEARWIEVYERLVRCRPALYDALLAELLASLGRRAARQRGRDVPGCLGRESRRFLAGRLTRLDRLGPPDLLLPSWSEEPLAAEAARRALDGRDTGEGPVGAHPLRGRFRETWRAALDRLRPAYLEYAREAAERGVLDDPSDAFFLPWDLADDLALPKAPSWLGPAVATNRREWESAVGGGASGLDAGRDRPIGLRPLR